MKNNGKRDRRNLDAVILEKFGRLTPRQQMEVLVMAVKLACATPPEIEIAAAFVNGLLPGGAA